MTHAPESNRVGQGDEACHAARYSGSCSKPWNAIGRARPGSKAGFSTGIRQSAIGEFPAREGQGRGLHNMVQIAR